MAAKKDTDLNDIAQAIEGLATLMDQRFEQVDNRFEQVDRRFEAIDHRFSTIENELQTIRHEQSRISIWLEKIDRRLGGVKSDIKEIYDRIVMLEKNANNLTSADKEDLARQLTALIKWAKQVSKSTGIELPKI